MLQNRYLCIFTQLFSILKQPICINCNKSITIDEWKRSYPFCRNFKEKNNMQKQEELEIESSTEQNAKEEQIELKEVKKESSCCGPLIPRNYIITADSYTCRVCRKKTRKN